MSRGINKVILIGNLGQDPDSRTTANGTTVTKINVATDESYKDKQSGQLVPKTEWHRVAFFNRLAEIAREYLRKGSKVYIEGKLRTNKWQDDSGNDRFSTEIIVSELQMLDSAQSSNGGASQSQPQPNQGYNNQPNPTYQRPQAQTAQAPQQGRNQYQPAPQQGYNQPPPNGNQDFDDDIPF